MTGAQPGNSCVRAVRPGNTAGLIDLESSVAVGFPPLLVQTLHYRGNGERNEFVIEYGDLRVQKLSGSIFVYKLSKKRQNGPAEYSIYS